MLDGLPLSSIARLAKEFDISFGIAATLDDRDNVVKFQTLFR